MTVASERAAKHNAAMNALPQRRTRSAVRRASTQQLDLFGPPRARRKPLDLARVALASGALPGLSQGPLASGCSAICASLSPGPDVVRFCPNLKRGETRSPGLVWLLRLRDQPVGIVRLYLDMDGRVVERRVLGRAVGATVHASTALNGCGPSPAKRSGPRSFIFDPARCPPMARPRAKNLLPFNLPEPSRSAP